MTRPRWHLPVFALVCAAQLAVAVSIIFSAERVLEHGTVWRFRTAPVDPVDLVRGRYVALRFEVTAGEGVPGETLVVGQEGYAVLEADGEGFARVSRVHAARPASGDYLAVRITEVTPPTARFDFPVDRFYMPEEQAPQAERAQMDVQRAGGAIWAEIRVHEGNAMIEQLMIDGVPVGEFVRRATAAAPEP